MAQEAGNQNLVLPSTGDQENNRSDGAPDWRWIIRWVLLTTAALPAALIFAAPFAAAALWIQNLGVQAGLWGNWSSDFLSLMGGITSLALTLAAAQGYMLRRWLPHARLWFFTTAAGLMFGGLIVWIGLTILSVRDWKPVLGWTILVLLAGAGIGIAQWLYLRRIVQNAFWIILIDLLAAGSSVFAGNTITSIPELLVLLLLPGVITGVGLWLLLGRGQAEAIKPEQVQSIKAKSQRLSRFARLGLTLAALVPLFFACSWVYAASQLALAKNKGIYTSPEEAIIALHSEGWGGATVVKLEDIYASPNFEDGALPHVWFGGATIYMDRIPEGFSRQQYSSGSFYLHVRDGWVHMPEGAFPGFVGWVMKLYGMEGVREWNQNR